VDWHPPDGRQVADGLLRLPSEREIAMKIYHLNCGTMHAFGFPLEDNTGGFFKPGHGVIHCLLVDTGNGLALVDTGWGTRDCTAPSPAVRQFANLVGCPYDLEETAIRQVEALGHDPTDVKHIFLTHMHLDHAGGLPDFPAATVHILADELEACLHPRSLREWWAYRPEHRAHGPKWQPHTLQGSQWFGMDCTLPIRVGEVEFVMIPFTGHTRGHCAVALRIGDRWLMHCGDAYTYYGQVDPVQPYLFPSGKLMEIMLMTGFRIPKRHRARIRELVQAHGDRVQTLCAHDAHEFALCTAP
jgi:glyoxylase-like metal-dependent hydrolase (beta-lactamase superfamily II)